MEKERAAPTVETSAPLIDLAPKPRGSPSKHGRRNAVRTCQAKGRVPVTFLLIAIGAAAWLSAPAGDKTELAQDVAEPATVKKEDAAENYDDILSNPADTCVGDISQFPSSWLPNYISRFENDATLTQLLDGVFEKDGPRPSNPWSEDEQKIADEAKEKGLDELIEFYERVPTDRIYDLGGDAVNSLFDYCLGSLIPRHLLKESEIKFQKRACDAAARVITIIAPDYDVRTDEGLKTCNHCSEAKNAAKMLDYVRYLTSPGILDETDEFYAPIHELLPPLTDCMKIAFSKKVCGGLKKYLGRNDWREDLQTLDKTRDSTRLIVRNFVHRSNTLTGLYLAVEDSSESPNFQMPDDLDEFTYELWEHLKTFPFQSLQGNAYTGKYNSEASHHGYLVTHAAYMPTG